MMLPVRQRNRMLFLPLLLALVFMPGRTVLADWNVPAELSAKVAQLPDHQQAFIASGAALEFLPERQLVHEITVRDAASLESLVTDIMALAAAMGYDPQRDMGAIPLNLQTPDFREGIVPTPAPLRKLNRAAGPFSVHRYLFPETGVATFAGAKVAIWPEDLVAGEVDVAIIGIPHDMSGGRRGAKYAPDEMRALDTIAIPDVQTLLDPLEVLNIVDYGNFATDNMSTEISVHHVAAMVAETVSAGAVPMMVGGDTSMLYPGVKGVAQALGNGSFGLLHFSAHPDADANGDHTVADHRVLYLLLSEGLVEGSETIQVGTRGPAVNTQSLQWLKDQGVRYHTMAAMQQQGHGQVLKRVLKEVRNGPDRYFVAVDVSVIEPAEMIAAGRMVPNGIRTEDLAHAIRQVCASKDIAGFEITDMAPVLDLSRLSVANANRLLNACLVGMAARKAGLKADYVHPLAANHGRR